MKNATNNTAIATVAIPCTSRSIKARMRKGFVVECQRSGLWYPIRAIRYNEGKEWRGLWVQEGNGLQGWFSPDKARCRQGGK